MIRGRVRGVLTQMREHARRQYWAAAAAYIVANFLVCVRHWRSSVAVAQADDLQELAICLRFRDEAPYLAEWLDYYIAAGVDHFFLYNNFSVDNYRSILESYVERSIVTLIPWPRIPASPDAENDCIARARGRFKWVGFIDADEFVVVRNGESIPSFLRRFNAAPATALHWYYYGSDGRTERPDGWVIDSYTARAELPNEHFKVFVRPERVIKNRNSHNFYYRWAGCAVNESGKRVFGSISSKPVGEAAWINHYVHKSLQDYLEKAARKSTLDKSGIVSPARQAARAAEAMQKFNDVHDRCARHYYDARLAVVRSPTVERTSGQEPSK